MLIFNVVLVEPNMIKGKDVVILPVNPISDDGVSKLIYVHGYKNIYIQTDFSIACRISN